MGISFGQLLETMPDKEVKRRIFVLEILVDCLWANRIAAVENQHGAFEYIQEGLKDILSKESSLDEKEKERAGVILGEHFALIRHFLTSGEQEKF